MEFENSPPGHSTRTLGFAAFAAAALVVSFGAIMLLSEDAEATHYWAGTLQWNHTPEQGDLVDEVWETSGQRVAFFSGRQSWRWSTSWGFNYGPMCSMHSGEGTLDFTDDDEVPFDLVITGIDAKRDRAIARIVAPNSPPDACTADPADTTYHVRKVFSSPNQGGGVPHKVEWDLCCRIEYGSNVGNYHVNNPQGSAGQRMHLETTLDLEDPNRSPIVDLVPLQFCAVDSICTFSIRAEDPDGDRLSYRLSTQFETTGGTGTFYQPGPGCGNCVNTMLEATVNWDTGLVTWNTLDAEIVDTCDSSEPGCPKTGRRNLYSMQIMVGDGTTDVPVDFMIELLEPPEQYCPDGSVPPVNEWTGEYEVDRCPLEPCEEVAQDLADCEKPKEREPYVLPPEDALLREPWYAPEHTPEVDMDPAISGREPSTYWGRDHVNEEIAQLDSDGDGLPDRADACPNTPGAGATDFDGDGLGDGCDDDMDNDGILNISDACPLNADRDCGVEENNLDASAHGVSSPGELRASEAPEREGAQVHLAEAPSKKSPMGLVMMVVLGSAMLVLLFAMSRNRDSS